MRNTAYIIRWIVIGLVCLALQFAVSYWATLTEKDPDLEETVQFGPADYPAVAARITQSGCRQWTSPKV